MNVQSRLATVVLEGVLWHRTPDWCTCFSAVLEATHKAGTTLGEGLVSTKYSSKGSRRQGSFWEER